MTRPFIWAVLGPAALAWGLLLLVQGVPIGKEHLTPIGTVVGFIVLLGLAFEHYLWRLRWLHGWFVRRPDLNGTWRVELQSDWIDPKTRKQVPLSVCYMGVTQTFSNLQMHLMTSESESWFIAERIRPSPSAEGYQVAGVYTNKPHMHLRGDRSEIHQGALLLNTHGPATAPETLTGEYWTDRKTSGRMTLSRRISSPFTRFEDAAEAFREAVDS